MRLAQRVEELPAYLFAEISRKIAEKRTQGVDVISFAIGDPDLPTPEHIIDALADLDSFERAVAFARRYDIAILHDGPYSEVAFDGYRPPSLLQADGARDTGIEFHSLSKTYNMTGWRIGLAAGNTTVIDALMRVKSNLDSGIPQAIQRMAIAAR